MKVPLCRPSLPKIDKYKSLLNRIWETGMITNFSYYAQAMEKEIAKFTGAKNVATTSSCDAGLLIALYVLNLPKGSEVILSSYTFNSTPNSLIWNGLKPVFADIDLETFCLDPDDVKKKITKKTKVIIGTHVFGNPCDVDSLREIAKSNGIILMFDAAQAYGSSYKGRRVGTLGDIEVFSFSGTKTVISAEGGAILTRNKNLMPKILLSRNYGFSENYNSQELGINSKISEFNAALGYLSLKEVKMSLKRRNEIAKYYMTHLKGVGDIRFQKVESGNISTFKDFCILTDKRDRLSQYLNKNGVETRNYFFPIHQSDYFKKFATKLPNTEYVGTRCLCIPIYNEINKKQLDYVIHNIKTFFNK